MEIEDSSFFVLENYLIREQHSLDNSAQQSGIDTSNEFILRDNIVYIPETGEEVPVVIRNDSVFGTYITYDTVFHISNENILRKYKGCKSSKQSGLNEYKKLGVVLELIL